MVVRFSAMLFHLRVLLAFLWVPVWGILGAGICISRWGDLNNNRRLGHLMGWGILKALGIRVELEGAEHLSPGRPCIYVANHQHAMDVPIIGSFCPERLVIIGKKELKWIPFFGIVFAAAGNVMIDRQNRSRAVAGLGETLRALKQKGASIFLFPEGTRNRGSGLLPFKKGAFYMAVEAQVPVIPIVLAPIHGLVDMKRRRVRPGPVRVRVLPPIETAGLAARDVEPLLQSTREKMLEALRGLEHPADHP